MRPAIEADLPRLPEIERSASEAFRGTDLNLEALMSVTPAEGWRDALRSETLWVVDDGAGRSIAFLGAEAAGHELHLREFDVELEHQGQGLGRRLLSHVIAWARTAKFQALTLTTFRTVPWNGPFYAAMGFRELSPAEMSSRLVTILKNEAYHGLDPAQRCAMRLDLDET
ncbi:GNAT family N-acetyltransferase [Sorangium cellulosum]|uniref:GNAT family N-acetyltransferase n=1 Tax=Sorangium cellulosum TaxID=56 RepID=UPI001F32C6C8|nr:GNAT family N-acetyltransferase [Sorangium cellulosum]